MADATSTSSGSGSKAATPPPAKNTYTVFLRAGTLAPAVPQAPGVLAASVQADSVKVTSGGPGQPSYFEFTGQGGTVAIFEYDVVEYLTSVPNPPPAS